jgi:uncharacterized membrane protein YkoI
MQMPHFTRLCVLLLALAGGCIQPAAAGPSERQGHSQREDQAERQGSDPRGDGHRRIIIADSGMSLDQAVSMVEKRYNARVVRTEVRNEGNRKIYVLRLLNDAGRVWTVRVDASSGSVS